MPEPGVLCRQCGTANPAGNNFCGQCGTYIAPRPASEGVVPLKAIVASDEEIRLRRNSQIVYGITAVFVLTCIALFVVIIVWRP